MFTYFLQTMDELNSDSRSVSTGTHRIGDKIEARYRGGPKWFPGRCVGDNRDGTYDIRYNDGDDEKKVPGHMIRKIGGGDDSNHTGSSNNENSVNSFRIGDKIEARYQGGSKWFKGRIGMFCMM
jgi:hypothetical protein